MPNNLMPQIKNIVFLMLENRSLDNLLGWLYEKSNPEHVFPLDSRKDYEGLQTGKYTNPEPNNPDQLVPVTKITDITWREILSKQWGVPYYDPWEALRAYPNDPRQLYDNWQGVMNQFYGNSQIINGLPVTKNGQPPMKGFLQDYYSSEMLAWKGRDILWTYEPEQLTTINSLARSFAVSDRWFSSAPTETNPNRAYSLCGTSLGIEDNGPYKVTPPYQQYDTLTLFNQLTNQGKRWKLYYADEWANKLSYTEYTFPQIPHGHSANLNTFYNDASAGTLPDFSYIEPHWTGLGTVGDDYHPPSFVLPSENFLRRVFTSLRSSPQWQNMLFIVTFDEHGGTYDHVQPPGTAINPDGKTSENGFKFDQYGARVPTLLISPYIRKGTVFRSPCGLDQPFDHTSFIKTILLWAGMTKDEMNLGQRAPSAPTFDGVLSDQRVNDTTDVGTASTPTGEAVALHPAGANKELQALLVDVPGAATKSILATCKTKEEIVAAVADYRKGIKTS
ncbi:MAG: alkaline phosphatase family protein [Gammaproteobacteria bacterium]